MLAILPWKWAIPISAFSAILHFFASEALFVLRVEGLDHDGNLNPLYSTLDFGCPNLGFIALTILACVVMCLTVGVGMIKLPRGSLLVGNNSLAISAACHPPEGDEDATLLPVIWGAVSHETRINLGVAVSSAKKWSHEDVRAGINAWVLEAKYLKTHAQLIECATPITLSR